MLKEAITALQRIASNHNSPKQPEACYVLAGILFDPKNKQYRDMRRASALLKTASLKGHEFAKVALESIHGRTKDGKFLGPFHDPDNMDIEEYTETMREEFRAETMAIGAPDLYEECE